MTNKMLLWRMRGGAAVGLTEHLAALKMCMVRYPVALQRWMDSGPDMARVFNEFERRVDSALCTSDMSNYEQRP